MTLPLKALLMLVAGRAPMAKPVELTVLTLLMMLPATAQSLMACRPIPIEMPHFVELFVVLGVREPVNSMVLPTIVTA